jgi:hypothetical protein
VTPYLLYQVLATLAFNSYLCIFHLTVLYANLACELETDLDPRITVAWCKRHEVSFEKIFNKSLLSKFAWAMEVDPSFRF